MADIILLEGIDGSGKSTVTDHLKNIAYKSGIQVVEVVRDPGTSAFGEAIRRICADPTITATSLSLCLAFMAARTELAKSLQESQAELIILDRYWPSTIAYQCFGGGVDRDIVLQHVRLLDELYPGAYIPRSQRFCMKIDINLAHERRMADKGRAGERFKAADMEFKQRVAAGYDWLCEEGLLQPIEIAPDMVPDAVARKIWAQLGRYTHED